MKYLISLLALLCVTLSSCTSDDVVDEKPDTTDYQDDSNYSGTITDSYVYTLPVIFHVLYSHADDPTQYVSADRLGYILNNVNDLYRGNVYGKSVNANVKFVLATKDENGKKLATPGVEYIQWTRSYPIDAEGFMSDRSGQNARYLWDPNHYINVMIYNFEAQTGSEDVLLGISNMPYTVEGENQLVGLDSVDVSTISKSDLDFAYCSSINSKYINTESTRYTQPDHGENGYTYYSSDINVTVAHELGHYLGLHHVFTEKETGSGLESVDSCFDSDYCDDTPSYDIIEYNNYIEYYLQQHPNSDDINMQDLVTRNNCDGDKFTSTDIMDYAIGYGFQISEDQRKRIRNVLYYSPLIPGPKKSATTRAITSNKPLYLPIRLAK